MVKSFKPKNFPLLFTLLLILLAFLKFTDEQDNIMGVQVETTPKAVITSALTPAITNTAGRYQVGAIVDGDTFKLFINNQEETVRLLGIDTPETKAANKPVECFGQEASAKLTSLLSGKFVEIEFDHSQGERDKYGRLLLYIWVEGLFVNKEMVKQGFAHEYTYNLPYKYQEEFKAYQQYAMNNKLGLWGAVCANVTPPTAI